ncbi:hypothetical protein TRVA0_007S00848 [Trichomonascus vanleenenianus]|uniref:uncharacterized protein n=1 Tax=Trichomonascus vanleenenianus TaxID=2268995 RepID=UPI003EC9C046
MTVTLYSSISRYPTPKLIAASTVLHLTASESAVGGPSLYIAQLFPSSVPPVLPATIQAVLDQTNCAIDSSVALTGCIIDALSHRFYWNWLKSIPFGRKQVHPEAVFVAGLSLASKFLEDFSGMNLPNLLTVLKKAVWATRGIECDITVDDLRQLELSILSDLDYNLVALLDYQGLQFMTDQFASMTYLCT